jgi:hypothetical protein
MPMDRGGGGRRDMSDYGGPPRGQIGTWVAPSAAHPCRRFVHMHAVATYAVVLGAGNCSCSNNTPCLLHQPKQQLSVADADPRSLLHCCHQAWLMCVLKPLCVTMDRRMEVGRMQVPDRVDAPIRAMARTPSQVRIPPSCSPATCLDLRSLQCLQMTP